MTRLPEKALLDGSKLPKTTTGEMKDALGKLRDYLSELLGEDSSDREAARLALGIDLAELDAQLASKSDRTELETRTRALEEDIMKRGVPVGSIDWLAVPEPPAGYLKCDGAAIGRDTYPDLFAAIGTTFGAGDGETTFNLPDMIGRFAEGSATPGIKKEAGLPNVSGVSAVEGCINKGSSTSSGPFTYWRENNLILNTSPSNTHDLGGEIFSLSNGNPIYGNSDTVQPPALTLLPCIKAFDAAVNSGLIDITELANEVTGKADKTQVANLAMPSDTGISVTVPHTDYSLTAPADGYLTFIGYGGNDYAHVNLYAVYGGIGSMVSIAPQAAGKAMIPVRKGQQISMNYSNLSNKELVFTYAEGSQP
ncbi:phage tail protein [Oxalobacter paraformigenes]|uniref:Phage tail collar domain-containing protein n=1 Tax=Oxalobacter paraformigenes TaxID=556268 RepID=C3X3R8_9BURK|nr:phage tail protein [Oxalobacter paraformigenes]EEO27854.1 hypothetical protein OFAG_01007 [Oxalobacter paraformigenes]